MAGALRQIQDFLTKTHDDALVKAKLPALPFRGSALRSAFAPL